MNEDGTYIQRQDEQGNTRVRTRSRSLKGGLDPAELGRKSGQARRERKARAERDAELDKLTVRARFATGLAGELTASNLRSVLQGLLQKAQEPARPRPGGQARLRPCGRDRRGRRRAGAGGSELGGPEPCAAGSAMAALAGSSWSRKASRRRRGGDRTAREAPLQGNDRCDFEPRGKRQPCRLTFHASFPGTRQRTSDPVK